MFYIGVKDSFKNNLTSFTSNEWEYSNWRQIQFVHLIDILECLCLHFNLHFHNFIESDALTKFVKLQTYTMI